MRNAIEFLTLLLTGGFALYALLSPYRVDGRITKAGKIAVVGCVIGVMLTIAGFGLRLKDAHRSEMAGTAQLQAQLRRHEELLKRLYAMSHPLSECRVRITFQVDQAKVRQQSVIQFLNNAVSTGRAYDWSDRVVYTGPAKRGEPEPFPDYSSMPQLLLVISTTPLSLGKFDIQRDANGEGVLFAMQDTLELLSLTYFKATDSLEVFFRFRPIIISNRSGMTSLADVTRDVSFGVALGMDDSPSRVSHWRIEQFVIASPAGLERSYTVAESQPERGYPHLSHILALAN